MIDIPAYKWAQHGQGDGRKTRQRLPRWWAACVRGVQTVWRKKMRASCSTRPVQEVQLQRMCARAGVRFGQFVVHCLEMGRVDIEVRGCGDDIADVLAQWLDEPLEVQRGLLGSVRVRSPKKFALEIGLARVAKGGSWLSGDSYKTMELPQGKIALALSDGMGFGVHAQAHSSAALQLLAQWLTAGEAEAIALRAVNASLAARTRTDMYATVDLVIMDSYDGRTTWIKSGSTPSYVIRGSDVRIVAAHNLPVGILNDIDIEPVQMCVQDADMIVMMTDGVYDDQKGLAPNVDLAQRERSIAHVLRWMCARQPQEIADALIDEAIAACGGSIADDMTVVVAKVRSVANASACAHHVHNVASAASRTAY
ncbi:MAG: SpoIIE family protein phosphatase [Paenibacillaceae bacterium]|nr:SpoIIE family protein phosphatase [Paenibacillaceae bacterium]